MQSVSPSDRIVLGGGRAASRVREALSAGRAWSFVLVLLLTLTVAESTNSFQWVVGIEIVVPIALFGAILMGAFALTPLAEPVALAIGGIVGVPLAILAAWPQIHLKHPEAQLGLSLVNLWWAHLQDGTLWTDTSLGFYLFLIALLMWIAGAWLSWCVLRWRKPMLGLIPGAAAFSTNALNVLPGMPDQNGFAFAMVVLIVILLLWNNYSTSIFTAARTHVRLTGDAKWDFWESGLVAMLVVVVIGMFAPQISKSDRTTQVESGIFTSWAQLQSEISHPGFPSTGAGSGGTTGFSDEVKLAGSIARNNDPVFVYSPAGEYGGPVYFRGLDITKQVGHEWRYDPIRGPGFTFGNNQPIVYGESYDALGVAAFTVKMVRAPVGFSNVVFYPGQLAKVDHATNALEVPLSTITPSLMSIDRLNVAVGNTGTYTVYAEFSGATVSDLEGAGTDYPDWVKQFAMTPDPYRSPLVLDEERKLALSITAASTTPYDIATAIQDYLRSSYTYDLNAPTDPRYDPIENFLFHSKIGYCEYFASAMGDMLRLLGIPTRLVNGFGPGTFDATVHSYVVHASDAHTWVEVYFPRYGWIPFEPTPQNGYEPPQRGTNGGNVCLREEGCDQPDTGTVPPVGGVNGPTAGPHQKNTTSGGSSGKGLSVASLIGPNLFTESLAAVLAVVLILLILAVRYLRPRTVMAVWNRVLVLASLAGAERRPGETPLELGWRLERVFPEAAEPVAALIGGFTIAAYAAPEDAANARSTVMDAWSLLRPQLLRRVLARFRPGTN